MSLSLTPTVSSLRRVPHTPVAWTNERAKSQDNLFVKVGENVVEGMIRFLEVRELINLSKVSRFCRKVSHKDTFWQPLLQKRFPFSQIEAALRQDSSMSQRQLYIMLYSIFHSQMSRLRKEHTESQIYLNSPKYSIGFSFVNCLTPAAGIASIILETSDNLKRIMPLVGSSLSLISLGASATIETCRRRDPRFCSGFSDDACRGIHGILSLLLITQAGLNIPSEPITSGLTFYNASIHFLKAVAPETCMPNLCARAAIKLQALWQGFIKCGKRVFCCRSKPSLSVDL